MSSRKGGQNRGPPCHQNKVAWVPNKDAKKNEREPGSKTRPLAAISAVCGRCREQIAWKRKYGKYKMLTEPAKCASCSRRTVRDAHHAICRECASEQNVCAKCRKRSDSIVPDMTALEREERELLEQALKNMRERDRRTLLRELSKPDANKKELIQNARLKDDGDGGSDDGLTDDDDDDDGGGGGEEEADDDDIGRDDGNDGDEHGHRHRDGEGASTAETVTQTGPQE